MSRVSCMSCVRTAAAILFSMRKKDQQRKPLLAKKRFKILQNIRIEKRCQRKSAGKLL